MKKIQTQLGFALLLSGLAAAVLLATVLLTGSIGFLYSGAAGVHTIFQWAALLAGVGLFVTALILFIPLALQPAKFGRKLLLVLPLFALGMALAGVVFSLAGIGSGLFASGWLAVGALLSAAAAFGVILHTQISGRTLKTAFAGVGISSLLIVIAWIGMLTLLVIVLTSQPSAGGGGFPQSGGGRAEGARPGGPGEGLRNGGANLLLPALGVGSAAVAVLGGLLTLVILRGRRAVAKIGELEQDQAAQAAAFPPPAAGQALLALGAVVLIFMLAIQLVPVDRTNPPVQAALQWDSPATQDLAARACLDCHSDQTRWPWYSNIAPASWLTVIHVQQGREHLNLSLWDQLSANQKSRIPEEMQQQIERGSMPPKDYLMIHADARLTEAEKQQLIDGLMNTLAK